MLTRLTSPARSCAGTSARPDPGLPRSSVRSSRSGRASPARIASLPVSPAVFFGHRLRLLDDASASFLGRSPAAAASPSGSFSGSSESSAAGSTIGLGLDELDSAQPTSESSVCFNHFRTEACDSTAGAQFRLPMGPPAVLPDRQAPAAITGSGSGGGGEGLRRLSPACTATGASSSSSPASELINVTLSRFPIRESTAVPKRIWVSSRMCLLELLHQDLHFRQRHPGSAGHLDQDCDASASIRPRSISGFFNAWVSASCARLSESDSPKPKRQRPFGLRSADSKSSKPIRISPGR